MTSQSLKFQISNYFKIDQTMISILRRIDESKNDHCMLWIFRTIVFSSNVYRLDEDPDEKEKLCEHHFFW